MRHQVVHTGKKAYKCKVCGKGFMQKYRLHRHEYSHGGQEPVEENSEKSEEVSNGVENSEKSEEVSNGVENSEKSEEVSSNGDVTPAQSQETVEETHKCDKCAKTFTARGHLILHQLLHTVDKPHKCETCGKTFTQKISLTRHRRIHSGEE